MSKKVQVLFICTGNSACSQMSVGLLRKMAGDIAEIYSAGTEPADLVNPFTVKGNGREWDRYKQALSQEG